MQGAGIYIGRILETEANINGIFSNVIKKRGRLFFKFTSFCISYIIFIFLRLLYVSRMRLFFLYIYIYLFGFDYDFHVRGY